MIVRHLEIVREQPVVFVEADQLLHSEHGGGELLEVRTGQAFQFGLELGLVCGFPRLGGPSIHSGHVSYLQILEVYIVTHHAYNKKVLRLQIIFILNERISYTGVPALLAAMSV